MAPEVRTSKAYDIAADVFSVGVVLYEIFALALPDYDDNTEEDIFIPHTYIVRGLLNALDGLLFMSYLIFYFLHRVA